MTFPIVYPAQEISILALLQEMMQLTQAAPLTPEELRRRGQTPSEFQLDIPLATATLQHAGGRTELRFGARTPVGDRVYVQPEDSKNLYVVNASVWDRLPVSPNDWRSPVLLDLRRIAWDRLEMRSSTRAFAIQVDPTNKTFYLSKPSPARADGPKILTLLTAIQNGRALQFVNDNPRADLEPYGLDAPRAELVFGQGTNDVATVRFGVSPTNDPTQVYALNGSHTNVVLVDKSFLDGIQMSHAELREKRLLSFLPDQVSEIHVLGRTNLVVRRLADGTWAVALPRAFKADEELMRMFLDRLGSLEGDVERDVVADFSNYGLVPPTGQYLLYNAVTNGAGVVTNRLLGRLDFGTQQEEKVFVRRVDEQSVYSVTHADFDQLPREAWQLRDRQVWSFATNDIVRVQVIQGSGISEIVRTGPARWEVAPGSQGVINVLAVEETLHRLGDLRADYWVARGVEQRARFGFAEPRFKLVIEIKAAGGRTQLLAVEFGQAVPNQFPFALTELEGEPVVFEFPKKLYFELVRDVLKPFWKGPDLP